MARRECISIKVQDGFLLFNNLKIKKMIVTKTALFPTRDNEKRKIGLEIIHIVDDFQNKKFQYQINDFLLDNEKNKNTLGSKIVEFTYTQRDGLKQAILQSNSLEGSESEINALLLPFALLYITTQNPIYNTKATDWELME